MGCSKWRTGFNFGHLKAQSKLSVSFTMIIIFSYLFYSLTGYCDSLPRPVYEQQSNFLNKLLLNKELKTSPQRQPDAQNTSPGSVVREFDFDSVDSLLPTADNELLPVQGDNNISISNNFGSKKFPQAIIIGVKKGGTRALLEFLRIHPDVRAVGAEPHFFDRFYDKGLEWYRCVSYYYFCVPAS